MLMRLGEATRRATDLKPHRALDRSAYVILRHLESAGPLNVSALADRLNLDGSTVTRQVTALERTAPVERRRDPSDGRGTVIAATDRGLEQMEAVRVARRSVYDRVLRNWTPEERAGLADTLAKFNDSLEQYMRAPRA